MNDKAKQLIFIGRVQGVGFRYTAYRIAGGYDITGFVRNLPDGTVEMLIQGPESDLRNCIEEIQEYFGRSIREIKAADITPDPRHRDFRIRY
ncbi:MAG: acylphosphatase [Phycisphaerae bacterium]|nr:acylphosphatase [Phycisphaerae bacterium]